MYIKSDTTSKTNSALIVMDTMENEGALANLSAKKTIEIKDIPFKQWVNIIIRLQNRILDVYVNGVLTGRKDLIHIPRQNYGSVNICQKGGFNGNLSNLRYLTARSTCSRLTKLFHRVRTLRQARTRPAPIPLVSTTICPPNFTRATMASKSCIMYSVIYNIY